MRQAPAGLTASVTSLRDILLATPAPGVLGGIVGKTDSAIRIISGVILWLSFLALFLPTFTNAILRYTTSSSLIWSVEIAQLTFPWFIAAGAALAAQHSRHIKVEFLLALLPPRSLRFILIAVQLLILLTCGGILYVYLGFGSFEGGMKFAAGDVAFTSLNIAQSWSYLAILAGYSLLALTALTTGYRLCFEAGAAG